MLKNIYILKIDNKKILKKIIKYKINIENIIYKEKYIIIYLDYYNYLNIQKYFKLFNIELIGIKGINRIIFLIKKYFIFIICNILGIFLLYFLSNIIFNVKILTNDKEIRIILQNELDYYNIKKYKLVKSFKEKEIIKNKILNSNLKKLEWMEITRSGSVYLINVERRIINDIDDNKLYRNVISSKNAFIIDIKASNGEIIKKVNDYVNKGDIIVSGLIKKKDKVVNKVRADAIIYGETWYNVRVNIPINYYNKIYTGKKKKRLTINFLNKRIKLFNLNNYKNEEFIDNILISNKILPIYISYSTYYEIIKNVDIYSNNKVLEIGLDIAKEKLLNNLREGSKVLSQKKLKLDIKDSKIVLDVFFKVYENITDYQEFEGDINGEFEN